MLILVAIVQSLNLMVFAWFHRVAGLRIIVLRQQLAIYKRMAKKPILRNRDRLFWSLLSRVWKDWASELIFVNPETVIRWRKRKFREFWRKKSQNGPGRPECPEKWGSPCAAEREKQRYSNWAAPQGTEAIWDFRGPQPVTATFAGSSFCSLADFFSKQWST